VHYLSAVRSTATAVCLWAVAGLAHAQPFGAWTDGECGGCHVTDSLFSHPVDVRPSMPIPSHLPLTDGRITCATCHDNADATAHAEARAGRGELLRPIGSVVDGQRWAGDGADPAGEAAVVFADSRVDAANYLPVRFASVTEAADDATFCSQCHDGARATRRSMHGVALGGAHLQWPDADGGRQNQRAESEDQSDLCLGCHDGSIGPEAGTGELGSGRGHPIGVSHKPVRAGSGAAPLVGLSAIDSRVRLFGGAVGCGSCHSPYAREDHLLVKSNRRSALCLSCHDL